MVTRAESITQTQKKADTYSDFPSSFTKHPITRELVLLKNEDSVKQAIKNAVLTEVGERFFNPYYGCGVRKVLFENFGPFMEEELIRHINLSVNQFEPRVTLLNVTPYEDPDNNSLSINIVFSVINNPEPISFTIFLRRVR
jgi:phage baseplate assembly protein W